MTPLRDRIAAAREVQQQLGRPDPRDEPDGRRRRGQTSRELIIRALLQLLAADDPLPSATQVAETAGVSLRTVYRHFNEMDALYREIAESMQASVLSALFEPAEAATWKGRLLELIERRIRVYEVILPIKISGDLRRFQSSYLMDDYRRHLSMEKRTLEFVLPAEVLADTNLARSIRLTTSFQSWRTLRKDQRLDAATAHGVLLHMIDALLASSAAAAMATQREA